MYGEELARSLKYLLENFEKEAVPKYGRYVKEPAKSNKNGVQYIPERANNPELLAVVGIISAVAAFALVWSLSRKKGQKNDVSLTGLFEKSFS
jgi:hypothetical protein